MRHYSVIAALALCGVMCTTPPHVDKQAPSRAIDTVAPPPNSADTARAPVAAPPPPSPLIRPALSNSEWTGRTFVLLRKNSLFEKFGYQLFDSPLLGVEKKPAIASIALKNHQLRPDIFAGRTVTVSAATQRPDSSFLITFTTDTLGATVYGVTRDGAIEGLAIVDDLTSARGFFLGRTVYSRRRLVDTYDSVSTKFVSKTVSISEPLKVVDIAWGRTPLPPKPIWVVVERPDMSRGFIPVNMSWTNVLRTKIKTGPSWEDDVMTQDPRVRYRWDGAVWETIDKHNIFPGMTREQVRVSWGAPKAERDSTSSDGRKISFWTYDAAVLLFAGDSLTTTP